MKRRGGFTLTELIIAIVVIGALIMVAMPKFADQYERARGAEARKILLDAYAGYARLLADGESTAGLSWTMMGMTNPNFEANRFFNYNIAVPFIQATRIGNASRWLRIRLNNGQLQVSSPY
jgi:prepilin-type N-terminal cleavage/methylation domain-containing protein